MSKSKKRRTYSTGSFWLRGRIWWIRWRDGSVQHYESTHSEDKDVAKSKLNARLTALGGKRRTVVDPERVTYEAMRENFLKQLGREGPAIAQEGRRGDERPRHAAAARCVLRRLARRADHHRRCAPLPRAREARRPD